jgi:hypothetical protein
MKLLFYPCSGNDLIAPIKQFANSISDFLFVDYGYFRPGHQDTRHYGMDLPADQVSPVLDGHKGYRLLSTNIVGPTSWPTNNPEITPCVLTETYLHVATGRKFNVHRRRGYGFSALRNEISSLDIFYYRGDSMGEGGSGNLWLADDHIEEVCAKLCDGGLIITDGSQTSRRNKGKRKKRSPYRNFASPWESCRDGSTPSENDLIREAKPFFGNHGLHFECIGFAGWRIRSARGCYRPTMIWRLTKNIFDSY